MKPYDKGRELGRSVGEAGAVGVGTALGAVGGFHSGLCKRFGAGKVLCTFLLAFWLLVVFRAPPATLPVAQAMEQPAQIMAVAEKVVVQDYDEAGSLDVPYRDLFIREGKRVDMPWLILAGIAKFESAFNPKAVSSDGYASRGLGQFIPSTWATHAKPYGYTWDDAFEPEKNVAVMADFANWLRKTVAKPGLTERQIVERIVCSWNWGPGNVTKYGVTAAPSRTRGYVVNVLKYAGY